MGFVCAFAVVLTLLMATSSTQGADFTWQGSATNDWFAGPSWVIGLTAVWWRWRRRR